MSEKDEPRSYEDETLYLDTIGTEIMITPNRARALIQELTNWLTDQAQETVDRRYTVREKGGASENPFLALDD